MSTQKSQRWQRRKDSRPSELLDAALLEFFEKGFEAARLEDIAARAGVTKGTIYLYFHSKEDVFEALVRSVPQANLVLLQQVTNDPDQPPEMLLERFLQLAGTFIRDERLSRFPRLVIAAAGRFPRLADIYRNNVIEPAVAQLAAIIEAGVKRGVFMPVDPLQAAYAAIAPLLFTAIWKTTFQRENEATFPDAGFAEQHIRMFMRGIRKDGGS